jgi:RNA polymerase sigma-70 factor (ECF subfamily)
MGTAQHVEELYTAHARLVRAVCRSLLRDRNEAEDAVQQTFLSAQRALANGSSPREPAAWLATIARNECLARVRERMREPLPLDTEATEAGGPDAHSAAVSRYEVATLREALADLPRLQREAILLRELRGLSYDEVARALSTTTGAVESLIFRARRTLQVKLSEALTAVSPFALFGRLLGAGGGDSVAPAVVAKVAAIGIGAAILAGGAAVGTHAFNHAAKKTADKAPPVHVHVAPPVVSSPHTPVWSAPAPPVTRQAESDAAASYASSSDTADTSSSDASSSDSSSSDGETSAAPVVPPTPTTPTTPRPGGSDGGGDGAGDGAGRGD